LDSRTSKNGGLEGGGGEAAPEKVGAEKRGDSYVASRKNLRAS